MNTTWKQWGTATVLAAALCGMGHAQLLIGQTAGYSGQVAAGVKETSDGAKLFIDAVNAKGASTGRRSSWSRWTTSSTPSWPPRTPAC